MEEKDMLEISEEMIGATDGKTCCTAFADPCIAGMKRPSPADTGEAMYQEKRPEGQDSTVNKS